MQKYCIFWAENLQHSRKKSIFALEKGKKRPVMMKKYLLFFLMAMLTAVPLVAAEENTKEEIENDIAPVSINTKGTQVHVSGAEGKVLEIFNLAGVRVASVRIDSNDKTLSLNLGRGCYILKVDKIVRKISIS